MKVKVRCSDSGHIVGVLCAGGVHFYRHPPEDTGKDAVAYDVEGPCGGTWCQEEEDTNWDTTFSAQASDALRAAAERKGLTLR